MLPIFFRAVILYTVSVAAVRLMGKRQIGQLQPYELVLAILIADLAAGPMSGAETPLAYGLVPSAALVIMHSAASLLGMKSPPCRRLLNGTARVSPKITSFYLVGENQEKLTQDMETKILTIMSDPAMAAQSECDLLMQDVSISTSKKKSLYAERDFSVSAQVAEFLSLLLCFAMQREFVKREARAKVCEQIILPPDYDPVVFTEARMSKCIVIQPMTGPYKIVKAENIFKEIPFALEKIFPPVSEDSEDAVEHAEQMKKRRKMLLALVQYLKETYQLGIMEIETGNEEKGHALVREVQNIYRQLYGEMPALMEEQRQMYREYLESNGIRFFQEPHKLTG